MNLHTLKLNFHDHLAKVMAALPSARAAAFADCFAPDVVLNAFHPVNTVRGKQAIIKTVLQPLWNAFPDLERCDDTILTGHFKDADWTVAYGHWIGTFAKPWLGIAPTCGAVSLRFGEYMRWQDGKVVEVFWIVDMLDLMRQAKCFPRRLTPPRGLTDRVPAPPRGLGVSLQARDDFDAMQSLKLVEAMITGLMSYDQKTLESMGMERFWHPEMMWYGPGGIGTSRALIGFQDVHQRAFLNAFPDRIGGDHKCRVGDGVFVASTGWPSVRASHRAPWLGAAATNDRISMRVMDLWRREDHLLRENWVMIDQLELLLQMGVDVLGRNAD
jgi:predicted ester cyclase